MKILVVAATEGEITGVKNFISEKNLSAAEVLISGVGAVATAYALTKQLQKKTYDVVFNFGIAGSFDRKLEMGIVVNIVYDCFADLGAEDGENSLSLEEMGLPGISEVRNESAIRNPVLDIIPKVTGITVNKVLGNEDSIKKVVQRFHPQTESMEGAAFLYCCMMEKIPCAQIRAVSNYVERRNKNNWSIPLAVDNLNKKAIEILKVF